MQVPIMSGGLWPAYGRPVCRGGPAAAKTWCLIFCGDVDEGVLGDVGESVLGNEMKVF